MNQDLDSVGKFVHDPSKEIGRNVNYRFALDSKTAKEKDYQINEKF